MLRRRKADVAPPRQNPKRVSLLQQSIHQAAPDESRGSRQRDLHGCLILTTRPRLPPPQPVTIEADLGPCAFGIAPNSSLPIFASSRACALCRWSISSKLPPSVICTVRCVPVKLTSSP